MDLMQQLINEVVNEKTKVVEWPEPLINSKTGKKFIPQNEDVRQLVYESDEPTYVYVMSPEGAGKTATIANVAMNKLKRGMTGAIVCVNLPMLIKVWDEIKRWIPWDCVVEEHQYMKSEAWTPYKSLFEIVFYDMYGGKVKLIVGGLGDSSSYSRWESLNISWAILEEGRSMPSEAVMKVLSGRIRMSGPKGEPPQLIMSSTPTFKDHWMYDWFGPVQENDPHLDVKTNLKIINLSLEDNLHNLAPGHIQRRGATLTEAEKEVFLKGMWGEDDSKSRFVENIEVWRRLYDPMLLPVRKKTDLYKDWSDTLVIAMDGAIKDDSFALVGVTRNPMNRNDIAVRITREFTPKNGRIDFTEVENELRKLCTEYNVVTIVFDIYQIYDLTERLRKEGIGWFQEFSQMNKRLLADNMIYELVLQGRIAHMNQPDLEKHVENAGTKYDADQKKRRIVKINKSQKVDLLVALSMASFEALRLNL